MTDLSATEAAIIRLTEAAGPGRSIAPADVAQSLAPGEAWRGQLSAVRRAAARLAEAGRIEILRKGKPVPPAEARGVIRLRMRAPD